MPQRVEWDQADFAWHAECRVLKLRLKTPLDEREVYFAQPMLSDRLQTAFRGASAPRRVTVTPTSIEIESAFLFGLPARELRNSIEESLRFALDQADESRRYDEAGSPWLASLRSFGPATDS